MISTILQLGTGKVSSFGGPADSGVGATEELALAIASDVVASGPFAGLFLPVQPEGTTGTARRLNPHTFYCAMRWNEVLAPFGIEYFTNGKRNLQTTAMLRNAVVRISNPLTGACIFARPVDYGPGDGKVVDGQVDPDTGRLIDLSPAGLIYLSLVTDEEAHVEMILPKPEAQS